MIKNLVASALIALATVASPAAGWGPDGHRVTAAIAWNRLSPAAQGAAARLIGPGQAIFVESALWADVVRDTAEFEWTRPLHYINVPPTADRPDLGRDCPEQACVLGAIEHYGAVLGSPGTRATRSEALRFLIHFVGDLHQPLHVSHAEDRGGNEIELLFFRRPTNLHELWDTLLLQRDGRSWRRLATQLEAQIADRQASFWTSSKPLAWAKESLDLARQYAYLVTRGEELNRSYSQRCQPVVLRRLSQGGVRLAALLEPLLVLEPPEG